MVKVRANANMIDPNAANDIVDVINDILYAAGSQQVAHRAQKLLLHRLVLNLSIQLEGVVEVFSYPCNLARCANCLVERFIG